MRLYTTPLFTVSFPDEQRATNNEHWGTNKPKIFNPLGKTPSQALEMLSKYMEIMQGHQLMFLSGKRGSKRGTRRWKMTPGVASLQQAVLRWMSSRWSRLCMANIGWLFKWSHVSWTWKNTMFGRLSPKIWACGRSAQKCCQGCWIIFRRNATCICIRTSLTIFKMNQTYLEESSLWWWDIDFRVRPGKQTPEHSVEQSDAAEAKESKTIKIKSQSHIDHILQCKRHGPLWVFATGPDNQSASLKRDPATFAQCSVLCSVGEKRQELWQFKLRLLHHANAPAPNALSFRKFLAEKNIKVLEQHPYSPNLAPWLFSFCQNSRGLSRVPVLKTGKPSRRLSKRSWGVFGKNPSSSAQKHGRGGRKSALDLRGITLKVKPCKLLLGLETNCLWHQSRYFSDSSYVNTKSRMIPAWMVHYLVILSNLNQQPLLMEVSDFSLTTVYATKKCLKMVLYGCLEPIFIEISFDKKNYCWSYLSTSPYDNLWFLW